MRCFVGLLCVSALLAGCGTARHAAAPLAKLNSVSLSGWPVLGSGPPGFTLRFIERGRFEVGIVLRNRSHETLTVVGARTLDPQATLVHQVATRLVPWKPPPPCPGRSCPFIGFPFAPFAVRTPAPVSVSPGRGVSVQLNFQLGSCSALPFAQAGAARRLEVDFRYGRGRLRREELPLGSASPHLRFPARSDCVRRPHSSIAVEGPYATSSAWTIPGSSADTCTRGRGRTLACSEGDVCRRTAAGVLFRSGLYESPGKPAVRIEILVAHRARVRAIVGIGLHGWTTFSSTTGVLTVRRTTAHELAGRFHATVSAPHRTPFRVFGAWRCSL